MTTTLCEGKKAGAPGAGHLQEQTHAALLVIHRDECRRIWDIYQAKCSVEAGGLCQQSSVSGCKGQEVHVLRGRFFICEMGE